MCFLCVRHCIFIFNSQLRTTFKPRIIVNSHLGTFWSVPNWESGDSEKIHCKICIALPRCSADESLARTLLNCGNGVINQDQENQGRCWSRDAELVDSGSTQKLEIRKEQQFISGKPSSAREQQELMVNPRQSQSQASTQEPKITQKSGVSLAEIRKHMNLSEIENLSSPIGISVNICRY